MGSSSTSKEESLHYALSKKPITRQAKPRTKTCKYCGKDPHDKSECPAKGDICAKCGKANHWAKVCRSAGSRKSKRDQQSQKQTRRKQHKQQVHQLENEENSDEFSDESLFHIQQVRGKQYFSILNINNANVKCQLDSGSTSKEPMAITKVPQQRWQIVSSDLFSIKSENYIVTVDHFSDYIELKQLEDTLSETVIQSLKNQFATHGIPCILISDNGPQYSSSEFAKFSKTWGSDVFTPT